VEYKFIPHKIEKSMLSEILDHLYTENPSESLCQWHIDKFISNKLDTESNRARLFNLLKRKGFYYNEFEPLLNRLNWK